MEILVILCLVELAVVVGAFWFLYILIERVAEFSLSARNQSLNTGNMVKDQGNFLGGKMVHVEQSLQTQVEFLLQDKKQVQALIETIKDDSKRLEVQLRNRDTQLYDKLVNLGKVTLKNEKN